MYCGLASSASLYSFIAPAQFPAVPASQPRWNSRSAFSYAAAPSSRPSEAELAAAEGRASRALATRSAGALM